MHNLWVVLLRIKLLLHRWVQACICSFLHGVLVLWQAMTWMWATTQSKGHSQGIHVVSHHQDLWREFTYSFVTQRLEYNPPPCWLNLRGVTGQYLCSILQYFVVFTEQNHHNPCHKRCCHRQQVFSSLRFSCAMGGLGMGISYWRLVRCWSGSHASGYGKLTYR